MLNKKTRDVEIHKESWSKTSNMSAIISEDGPLNGSGHVWTSLACKKHGVQLAAN